MVAVSALKAINPGLKGLGNMTVYYSHVHKLPTSQASTMIGPNVGSMLNQRRRRWANIEPALSLVIAESLYLSVLCICSEIETYKKFVVQKKIMLPIFLEKKFVFDLYL